MVAIKGDWQLLKLAFNMQRHYSTEQICWLCHASKGNVDPAMCYAKLNGAWRHTILASLPWLPAETPALSFLRGFNLLMVAPDLLHCWHKGHGADMIASVIAAMLEAHEFGRFHQLETANADLSRFLKRHRMRCTINLSNATLGISSTTFPELHGKGADATAIHKWLVALVADNRVRDPLHARLIQHSDIFLTTVMGCGWQMSPQQAIVAQQSGMAYLTAYIAAADHARQQKKRLFWLRPKFHAFTHAVLSCHRPSRRSVHMDACWMDEDFVGKLMDVMATASNYSTSSQKVCERWLVGLPDRMAHSASQSHS